MPLIDMAVRTSMILLLALGATFAMRHAAAATRHLVWTLAVVGALTLPVFTAVMPAWRVLPGIGTVTASPQTGDMPADIGPEYGAESAKRSDAPQRSDVAQRFDAAAARISAAWLVTAWALIALVLIARIVSGIVAVCRLARHARPADARWRALLEGTLAAVGMLAPVRLLVSRDVAIPMTWGGRRPIVLLPADALEWPDDRARVVLLHEIAHVRRADWLTHVLGRVLLALHWFNPLTWIALGAMTRERERACDDFVLAQGARPADYAQHLLDIARRGIGGGSYVMAPAMARRSELEGRLLSILTPHCRRSGRVTPRVLAAVAILTTIGIAAAAPASGRREADVISPQRPNPAPNRAPSNWSFQDDDSSDDKRQARRERAGLKPLAAAAVGAASEDLREKATMALALRSEPDVVEPLLRALKDPSSQVREKAALGLAFRRDGRVVDALLEAIEDPDSQVREKAALGLGLSGDGRAVDALTRALEDPDSQVREKAAGGLALFPLFGNTRR